MMEESAEDIENPPPIAVSKTNPHNNTPSNDPNKRIKIVLLSTFLLIAIVLAIALGVSFQGNPSNNVEEVGEEGELFTITYQSVATCDELCASVLDVVPTLTSSFSYLRLRQNARIGPNNAYC